MSLFSFGATNSQSNSQSSSFNQSQAASASGGFGVSGSQDAVAFEDVFANLFGSASGAASGLDPSLLTGAANSLFNSGSGFMDGLGGDAGSNYLENRLGGDNEVLQQQIDLLGQDLGNFFSDEINPQITSQAISGGQLGGGRQGVAQGLAASALGDQFTRGATALRAGDIAARDSAAGLLSQNNVAGAQVGLGGLNGLAGLADMGFGAGLAPFERLAAILGGPTTLGSSSSESGNFANAFSNSFGSSQATQNSSTRAFRLGAGET